MCIRDSSLGDYIYDIAIIVYLYQETGSSLVLGSFFIFQFVPTLIFTPFIGTLIDKLDQKQIIIFTNIIIVIFAYLIIGFGASTAPIGIRSLLQINISKNMICLLYTSVT